jgi:small subunit ribosomal protein S8
MVNDPIGDMAARLKNAYMAKLNVVEVPTSKLKAELAALLKKLGYIKAVEQKEGANAFVMTLVYPKQEAAFSGVTRISKPGLRRYVGYKDLTRLGRGLGHLILSTPKGLKSHIDAKKDHLGGELLLKIW